MAYMPYTIYGTEKGWHMAGYIVEFYEDEQESL